MGLFYGSGGQARSFCLGFPGLAFRELPAPWSSHELRVQWALRCRGREGEAGCSITIWN